MWRKICDVFSHSGEDKNEMLPQYLWILSRFRSKNRRKNDCITIVFCWHKHDFIWFFKFPIDLASIFQFCRSINIAIIAYNIDYIEHKLLLFTFSTKNKMADDDDVGLFLWSVHLIICSVHDWRWSGGPRPPEIMSDHQNILSSGPVDHQNI